MLIPAFSNKITNVTPNTRPRMPCVLRWQWWGYSRASQGLVPSRASCCPRALILEPSLRSWSWRSAYLVGLACGWPAGGLGQCGTSHSMNDSVLFCLEAGVHSPCISKPSCALHRTVLTKKLRFSKAEDLLQITASHTRAHPTWAAGQLHLQCSPAAVYAWASGSLGMASWLDRGHRGLHSGSQRPSLISFDCW